MRSRRASLALSIMLLAGCWPPAHGQEIDTVIFDEDRTGFRIVDQIQDPVERRHLEQLLAPAEPPERLARARSFLDRFPGSAFLSVVLDIAARSAVQTGDPAAALRYARFSLKLLPENPLLLALAAELHVDQDQPREAVRLAGQARATLDRFARPATFSPGQWEKLAAQTRSSALRSQARVSATAALQTDGDARRRLLEAAYGLLSEALESDPGDETARYWIERTRTELGGAPPVRPSRPAQTPPRLARYAGTERCRTCHAAEHANWSQTGMARMFRPIGDTRVLGEFPAEFVENGATVARMLREAGKLFFEFPVPDGRRRFEVHFAIGSKWQQAYATRLEDGRIEVFPLQYNAREKRWLNFWRIIDPPGTARSRIGHFTTFDGATTYQKHCAPCHTSQLRMTTPAQPDPAQALFREPGINCEMCHGPSELHAARWEAGKRHAKPAEEPPLRFAALDAAGYVGVCAQCHRQSAMFQRGARGELNYSGVMPDFPSKATSRPLLEFSRQAFYRDGRFRESTFIAEALERSQCYQAGKAHCGHCHNPHPGDAATNPVSLKYPADSDRMCLQCHTAMAAEPWRHTHHEKDSPGSRCVSCHMPKLMHSLLFQARTHTIDDIPDPALTLRFGKEESPNACLDCHAAKDAAWVQQVTQKWWGWRGSELE